MSGLGLVSGMSGLGLVSGMSGLGLVRYEWARTNVRIRARVRVSMGGLVRRLGLWLE